MTTMKTSINKVFRDTKKELETLNKVEIIFSTFAKLRGAEETLALHNLGSSIQFGIYCKYVDGTLSDNYIGESEFLDLSFLESLTEAGLTETVLKHLEQTINSVDPVKLADMLQEDLLKKINSDKTSDKPGLGVKNELLLNFNILSFANDKFSPHSVERLTADRYYDETFTIGDFVTNGTQMRGRIVRFELYDLKSLYVYTDWSNVGMNLESISKIEILPSAFQIGDEVKLQLNPKEIGTTARINAVHYFRNKVKYDLEIYWGALANQSTRIYNIDSAHVKKN